MKKLSFIFIAILLTFVSPISSFAQQATSNQLAAYESEIANLKEQITQIIHNSQQSLEDADTKLELALRRISVLEVENEQLTEQTTQGDHSKYDQRSKLARKLSEYERKNEILAEENRALKKQVTILIQSQQGESNSPNNSDVSGVKSERVQLKHLREREQLLEANNAQAYKQIVDLKANLRGIRADLAEAQKENQLLKTEMNEQQSQCEGRLALLSKEIKKYQLSEGTQTMTHIKSKQIIDSLKYELTSMSRMIVVLNQTDKVSQSRLDRLEESESDIRETAFKLEIREQLLATREREFGQRMKELVLKEEKYHNLADKERELKLLEQRLRQYAGKDLRTSR